LTAINTRYACRSFSDRPVPADTLKTIAAAGLAAPSAMNRQPWRIITVSDPAALAELETTGMAALQASDPAFYARMQERGGKLLYNAPAVILVAEEKIEGPFPTQLDCGIVVSHLALAATALGVDSVIALLPQYAFNGSDGPALSQRLGIPDGFGFGVALFLGYAAGAPGTPHTPDQAKLIEVA
jgi:nitroreductase